MRKKHVNIINQINQHQISKYFHYRGFPSNRNSKHIEGEMLILVVIVLKGELEVNLNHIKIVLCVFY